MQQKAMKLRRQRRAWSKQYSRSNSIIPNKGVLNEYKERALGLGVSDFEADELFRKIYRRDPIEGIAAGKAEVNALMKELKNKVPEEMFFVFIDNSSHHVCCYFNSTKTSFVLGHTDKRQGTYRRSIEYGSKERALNRWDAKKVIWVYKEDLPQSTG